MILKCEKCFSSKWSFNKITEFVIANIVVRLVVHEMETTVDRIYLEVVNNLADYYSEDLCDELLENIFGLSGEIVHKVNTFNNASLTVEADDFNNWEVINLASIAMSK